MYDYYVVYDIPKMGCKNLKSGPFSSDQIRDQLRDIEGYEGVENARVISGEEVDRLAEESDSIVNGVGFTD